MNKRILLLLLMIVPLLASAQYRGARGVHGKYKRSNFAKKNKIKREYVIGLGAANFLGELGGANQIGTNFVKDLEFSMTRPSAALGMRYKFNSRFALKGGFYYQLVSGNDKTTKEPFRSNRNLSFRSSIYELSIQSELYLTREQTGHRYKIKNAKGMKSYDFQAYVFVGFGGFFFNPQAKYNGSWVNLRPLSTEGEGMPGGPKKYSRFSVCIPYGLGVKEAINRDWCIGLEIGMRKTFTDYIDDVSTVYYDNNAIRAEKGDMAAYLADPSLSDYPTDLPACVGCDQTATGQQRGDKKDKDAYFFINITAAYKIPNKHRTRSKF